MSPPKPSDSFEYPELKKLSDTDPPDFASLKLLQLQINANAMAVHSTHGDGLSGLLALTVPADKYLQVSGGVAFTPPTKPSDTLRIANNATAAAVARATQKKDKEEVEWITYNLTTKALHQQLLKAVPRRWISELADDKTDFAGVPPLAILTHLWERHGKISQGMLADNLTSLTKEWHVTEPMTNLWQHVKKCTDFAKRGKEPIHQDVVLRAILGKLEATSEFTLDIRDWKKLPEAEKTIVRIQSFFEKANDQRLETATPATQGYACRAEQGSKRKFEPSPAYQHMQYCWSHGLNRTHDSLHCTRPAPKHNNKATPENMMGGCNLINRVYKEEVIWEAPAKRAKNRRGRNGGRENQQQATTTNAVDN
jgi:hypothetical protein